VLELRAGRPLENGKTSQVDIAADRGWQSSGTVVEQGKTYRISAEGRFVLAQRPKPWESEPDGISIRYQQGLPLGMLVAAVRGETLSDRPPYSTMLEVVPVGRRRDITPSVSGTLHLRLNDNWGELADNNGSVHVTIERE